MLVSRAPKTALVVAVALVGGGATAYASGGAASGSRMTSTNGTASAPATPTVPAGTPSPVAGAPTGGGAKPGTQTTSTSTDPSAPTVTGPAALPDTAATAAVDAAVAGVTGLQLAAQVAVAPVTGDVLVHAPGAAIEHLDATPVVLPTGSTVDARDGVVALASVVDPSGRTQVGHFWGGIFQVRQSPKGHGMTTIVLRHGDFGPCTGRAAALRAAPHDGPTAVASRKHHKPARSLWGSDDHGRFQTSGRGSVATVRGTRWLTEDYCDGTRTTVYAGAVAVRDRAHHRTVVVHAGHSYFAAAPTPRG